MWFMLCSQGYVLLHLILNTDPMKVHLQFLIQWCDVNIHNYQYHQFHRGGGEKLQSMRGVHQVYKACKKWCWTNGQGCGNFHIHHQQCHTRWHHSAEPSRQCPSVKDRVSWSSGPNRRFILWYDSEHEAGADVAGGSPWGQCDELWGKMMCSNSEPS